MKICLKIFIFSSLLFSLIYSKCLNEEYEDLVASDFTDITFDEHVDAKTCSKRSFDSEEKSLGAEKCCYFILVNCKLPYYDDDGNIVYYDRNIKTCSYLTESGVKNKEETIRLNSQYCSDYDIKCSGTYLSKLLYFIFILIFL